MGDIVLEMSFAYQFVFYSRERLSLFTVHCAASLEFSDEKKEETVFKSVLLKLFYVYLVLSAGYSVQYQICNYWFG